MPATPLERVFLVLFFAFVFLFFWARKDSSHSLLAPCSGFLVLPIFSAPNSSSHKKGKVVVVLFFLFFFGLDWTTDRGIISFLLLPPPPLLFSPYGNTRV